MLTFFTNAHPIIQALLATTFTWAITALGASLVFLTKNVSEKILNTLLGFAAGVMLSASFWSLLVPAVALSETQRIPTWFPATVGFLAGSLLLLLIDKLLARLHADFTKQQRNNPLTKHHRSTLLILAIILNNIPEGLAVGVAFGAVAAGFPEASLTGALTLTLGIAIQNFPEGLAVSMPMRREGLSREKSFWYGQLSGLAEPLASIVGVIAVLMSQMILPYALSFAAGAMIFVVIEELIPKSQEANTTDLATIGAMVGFVLMMILSITLG